MRYTKFLVTSQRLDCAYIYLILYIYIYMACAYKCIYMHTPSVILSIYRLNIMHTRVQQEQTTFSVVNYYSLNAQTRMLKLFFELVPK